MGDGKFKHKRNSQIIVGSTCKLWFAGTRTVAETKFIIV